MERMNPSHVLILTTLWLVGCNGDNPVGPTAPFNPLDVPVGQSVTRPAFKVMTYNIQLLNAGAPNPEARTPMILQIIRSEAADIVGLQELGFTHRAEIEAGLQDLYDFHDGQSGRNSSRSCCGKTSSRSVEKGWCLSPRTSVGVDWESPIWKYGAPAGLASACSTPTRASIIQPNMPSSWSTQCQVCFRVSRRS